MFLDVFTNYITKRETQEAHGVETFVYTKNTSHAISVDKYISIDGTVENYKDAEKKKKIRVTHDYFL